MLSCCLKWWKNTKNKNPKVVNTRKEEWCFHQNKLCILVKNQDLSKRKKKGWIGLVKHSQYGIIDAFCKY